MQNITYINKCFENTKGCGDVNPNPDNSGSSPKVRPLWVTIEHRQSEQRQVNQPQSGVNQLSVKSALKQKES